MLLFVSRAGQEGRRRLEEPSRAPAEAGGLGWSRAEGGSAGNEV